MPKVRGLILAVFALLWAPLAMAADSLNGRYIGLQDAAGASILISPDANGYRGTFFDPQGRSQEFEADRVGETAEAVLDMDQRTVLLRLAPLPYGAEVALIPFDGAGQLVIGNARVLTFVREGTRLPQLPSEYVNAPRSPLDSVTGNGFVQSYQFWEPSGVAIGYLAIPARFRTLIKMFPSVQLDVIWKLCLAPGADTALAVALRGQGVTCPQVLDTLANVQRANRFDRYKSRVEEERQSLTTSVRCADGYLESKGDCEAAARRLSQQAVSLQTAGMILRQLR